MARDGDIMKEPQATLHERIYEIAKPVVESVPYGGPIAVLLYNKLVGDPVRERLVQWIEDIAEQVGKLMERTNDVALKKLEQDPLFRTILRRAAWSAINDHQTEKLKALRNAVLNSACSINVNENYQLMFLNLIDRMTELHLRVLIFLSDPKKPLREMSVDDKRGTSRGSLMPYLLKYFDIPQTDPHPLYMVITDLKAAWLVHDDVFGERSGRILYASCVTPPGEQLVRFITSPLPDDE